MVRLIDSQKKKGRRWKIACLISMAIIMVLTVGITVLLNSWKPIPEDERNRSKDGITMFLDTDDIDSRRSVVISFTADEFDSLAIDEQEKMRDRIDGNISGDIPNIRLSENAKIYPVFQNGNVTGMKADEIPEYKLICYANTSGLPANDEVYLNQADSDQSLKRKIWEGQLSVEGDRYCLDLNNLTNINSMEVDSELFCMCYMEVRYRIADKDYVSATSFSLIE